jgi:Ti-type conjugative transfer relaxase TraA
MIPRCKVGKGVTGAVRYILGEGRHPETGDPRKIGPDQISRVGWIGGVNFGFDIESREDAELARRIMEFDALNQASRTRQCEKDCVHLSLGWRPGEQPTREQMEAAAHDALKAIGMGNAKALFSSHNDEDYSHVHIVASKINPDTGRAYDLKGNYLKLSRWAEQYERDHSGGIVCTRREEANRLRDAIANRDAGAVLTLMTEQRSTFTGRDLDRALSKQIRGELDRAQFTVAVLDHPEAVRLSDQAHGPMTRYSTRQVLEAEAHVLRASEGLARSNRHQIGERTLAAVLSSKTFDEISREQVRAVRHATEKEGLALIDGQAGTGKSYTMAAIRHVYETQRYKVVGLAPTNAVAQDMQQQGFAHARTVHSELFSLNNERTKWDRRTVVMVDEAAMLDTRNMAMLTAHAHAAGAKLILVGDDRQLSSIERGGMFGVLKDRYGAAELATVRRQHKNDDRRAAELMAEGNFHTALEIYDAKRAIQWTRTQPEARASLVAQWAKDSAADPAKSRFVFAYTNDDVDRLNRALRAVRKERGELEWEDHSFETRHGRAGFSTGDRIQFTGTDKPKGLLNGQAGTVQAIDGNKIKIALDGRGHRVIEFDAAEFKDFRHGYAGTIYRGQGRTLDQTYLYHSEHWRSAASYVALTRHRDKAELFVATNTAADLKQLARQMARVDERRAASHFHQVNMGEPVRPLTPRELAARLGAPAFGRGYEQQGVVRRQQEESDKRQQPAVDSAARAARDRDQHLHPPAAGETKAVNRNERFTPPGQDRPPDARGRTQDEGRGGRGGRTR